jgi:predicted Zn-dependent peptidase
VISALFGPAPRPSGKPYPPAAIKKALKALFTPANALVVTTAGFTQAELEALLSPYKGGAANPRDASTPKLPVEANGAGAVAFRARGGAFSLGSPTTAAHVRVAQELLELTLAGRLQKEGLGEDVRALTVLTPEAQVLAVLVLGQEQPTQAPDPLVTAALDELRKGTVDADLFARAKQLAQRRLERDWRSPELVAEEMRCTGGELFWSGAEVQAALEALKKDDFEKAAKELLPAARKVGVTQKLPAALRAGALPVVAEELP